MNKHEQKPSEDEQKLSEDKTTRTPIYTLTIVMIFAVMIMESMVEC